MGTNDGKGQSSCWPVSVWIETFSQPYIHPWEPPEAVERTACRPDGSVGDCEALETGLLKQMARQPVRF